MKKIISMLLLAVLLLSLLSGCHGSKDMASFEVPEAFDTSRNYEISFWAKNDTNQTQVDIYKQAIADFQELYPNITVNLRLYTDYGKIYNDVITNIATDTTPNVCITYPDHIATAVHFTQDIQGDYMTIDGKKYLICDPTYVGANIGKCMPSYMEVAAGIIKIE